MRARFIDQRNVRFAATSEFVAELGSKLESAGAATNDNDSMRWRYVVCSARHAGRHCISHRSLLKHDPEKWLPVFGKDHAQTKANAKYRINLKSFRFGTLRSGCDRRTRHQRMRHQRTRDGLLLSNFQPGIRYCIAIASSRAPSPCAL